MRHSVHVTGVNADVVTSHLHFDEALPAVSLPFSATCSAACLSASVTLLELYIVTHVPANMRVRCVCAELSSSTLVLEASV